jgi:arylformamidase
VDATSESPQVRGPEVWLGMDQRELDDAYDQAVYAPNRDQVLARYQTNSERARQILGAPRRLSYGNAEVEQLDLFVADQATGPVNIFIHGGGWRSGLASAYSQIAETYVRTGAHLVIPDFAPIDVYDGDLRPMVKQLRGAIMWVYEHAESFGGDPNRIFLTGHSSGAHLGGCLVTTNWSAVGLPADLLKGAVLCSGMYDLKPVRLSARSEYVRFTDEIEEALSPIRNLDRLKAPLVVSYGTYETPEFQRQSRELAEAVQKAGKSARLLVADGYNHFEILETLNSPYGLLGRAVLEQMGLGSS